MKQFHVRTLLQYTTQQLWCMLHGRFVLVFDDGTKKEVSAKSVLYSSYFWDLIRRHPECPLLPTHHVDHFLKGKPLTSKTHIELVQSVYWAVVDHCGYKTPYERDYLTKMIYEVVNDAYNDLSQRCSAYVMSIDILDFVGVTQHPKIKTVIDALEPTGESIVKAYETITEVLNTDPALNRNALAKCVRAKTVNHLQVLQCVGPRGKVTEVDGYIIPTPILRSFTSGMRTAFNMLVEAQSAAKSLYFSEAPLQDSEYFARRLQLLCMTVEYIFYTDCGSQDYLLWQVKGPIIEDGKMIYPGDLTFLEGKYRLDEESNTLRAITLNDTHLNGTTVKLRSALYCKHPNPYGVCSVCFGQLADNLNPVGNLGHVCSTTITQQTSQSVLSTKHLDANSSSEPVVLNELGKQYFTVGKNKNTYIIRKDGFTKSKSHLIVAQNEARGLTDILITPNVEDINPSRIAEIDTIAFVHQVGNQSVHVPVTISQNKRLAMLTPDFLRYLKHRNWSVDANGNFVFDLVNWDFSKPVFQLPEKEYSFAQHSHQVAEIIESRMKDISERMKADSPASTLVELFELVNSKLRVNLAALEVVVYASMVADGNNRNSYLARSSPTRSMGVTDLTIRNRSLGPALAYECQANVIANPQSFYKEFRPDSPMDVFVCPREVVEAYR